MKGTKRYRRHIAATVAALGVRPLLRRLGERRSDAHDDSDSGDPDSRPEGITLGPDGAACSTPTSAATPSVRPRPGPGSPSACRTTARRAPPVGARARPAFITRGPTAPCGSRRSTAPSAGCRPAAASPAASPPWRAPTAQPARASRSARGHALVRRGRGRRCCARSPTQRHGGARQPAVTLGADGADLGTPGGASPAGPGDAQRLLHHLDRGQVGKKDTEQRRAPTHDRVGGRGATASRVGPDGNLWVDERRRRRVRARSPSSDGAGPSGELRAPGRHDANGHHHRSRRRPLVHRVGHQHGRPRHHGGRGDPGRRCTGCTAPAGHRQGRRQRPVGHLLRQQRHRPHHGRSGARPRPGPRPGSRSGARPRWRT